MLINSNSKCVQKSGRSGGESCAAKGVYAGILAAKAEAGQLERERARACIDAVGEGENTPVPASSEEEAGSRVAEHCCVRARAG
jgi:hypothetical protein